MLITDLSRWGCLLALLLSHAAHAQEPGAILPLRDQAEVIDRVLGLRFKRLVPTLMREHDVDMWILSGREYDEDPVLKTMLPATWLNARRRTILCVRSDGQRDPARYARSRA